MERVYGLFPRLAERARSLKIKDGIHLDAEMGPIVTREARDRIEGYIGLGVEEGASLVVDGRDLKVSVNALRYAFNKNPRDEKLLGLLNMVEKEANVQDVTRRLEGPGVRHQCVGGFRSGGLPDESTERVHRLRLQAKMPHHRDADVDQAFHRVEHGAAALELHGGRARLRRYATHRLDAAQRFGRYGRPAAFRCDRPSRSSD